ncbi:triose-phosphate isomerase [Denitratisoma sp. agr-D3]
MRQRLVIGNWKMHGRLASNLGLLHAVKNAAGRGVEVGVCVPYVYLAQARSVLGGSAVAWGAQDVSAFADGAFTGEVSAPMLADLQCKYVLVGHSERRTLFGETDAEVAAKTAAALKAGLRPVVCVGETLVQRDAGKTEAIVLGQLDAVIGHCGVAALARCVVAYEPVWAIGTGKTASPEQAQDVHGLIRHRVAQADGKVAAGLQILYGGSVKPESAAQLFSCPDVDGGLIGGASLKAEDFLAICAAA